MVEHIAGIKASLDLLELRVIVLVIQGVPGDSGGIPLRIGEVHIGVVDQGPIAHLFRHRYAARLSEEISIELANPGQAARFVLWVCPAGRARHSDNRFPLGRGCRFWCHCVHFPSVGCHAHPTRYSRRGLGQVVISNGYLVIREALAQERIFELEDATL